MVPVEMEIPVVAPVDVGAAAAQRLMTPVTDTAVQYIEGPPRYTVNDVANTLAAALGRKVLVEVTPRDSWETAFKSAGFSQQAASAYPV
jgi:uncharacterized protein YbjT (DUF2867 family)